MITRKRTIGSMTANEPSSAIECADAQNATGNDASAEATWRLRTARLATLGTMAVALAAAASVAGRNWWLFDLASHFQVHYCCAFAVFVVLLLVARRWSMALAACALLGAELCLLQPFY